MKRQPSTMTGWIKRRARQFMREFGTPRAKAVRYASDDWAALRGGDRVVGLDLGRDGDRDRMHGGVYPLPGKPFAKVARLELLRGGRTC